MLTFKIEPNLHKIISGYFPEPTDLWILQINMIVIQTDNDRIMSVSYRR